MSERTHYEGCWRDHHACLMAKAMQLLAEVAQLQTKVRSLERRFLLAEGLPFADQHQDPDHFLIWPIRDKEGRRTGRWECTVWPDGSTTSWRRTGQRPVARSCGERAYADSSSATLKAGNTA